MKSHLHLLFSSVQGKLEFKLCYTLLSSLEQLNEIQIKIPNLNIFLPTIILPSPLPDVYGLSLPHVTELNYTLLHFTSPYITSLCTEIYCILLYSTSLPHSTSLYITLYHITLLQSMSHHSLLHFPTHHLTSLHSLPLYCTVLYVTLAATTQHYTFFHNTENTQALHMITSTALYYYS